MSGRARAAAGISSLGSTENFSRPGRAVPSPAPLRAARAMSLSHYPGTGTTAGWQKSHVFLDRQVARFDPHRRPVTVDRRHLESRAGNPRLHGAARAGNIFPLAPAGPAQVFPRARSRLQLGTSWTARSRGSSRTGGPSSSTGVTLGRARATPDYTVPHGPATSSVTAGMFTRGSRDPTGSVTVSPR